MSLAIAGVTFAVAGVGVYALEDPVECVKLNDDELWRAIAQNTDEMSVLIEEQLAFEVKVEAHDPNKRADLIRSHLKTINKFQREYRDCVAELRRRYP